MNWYCTISQNRSTVSNWSLPNTALEAQQGLIFETPSGPCPAKSLVDWWSTCLLDLFLHHKSSKCSLDWQQSGRWEKVCQRISELWSAGSAEPTSFRLRTVCFPSKTCSQTEPRRTKPLVDWLLAKGQSRARCIPCLSLEHHAPGPALKFLTSHDSFSLPLCNKLCWHIFATPICHRYA